VDVVGDFTRLTLDAIAFCTFSHRFNSFYTEDAPPFVEAMARSLKTAGGVGRRLPGSGFMYKAVDKQYREDIQLQHDIADEVGGVLRLADL
jgi:cytochrome P450/NADPH-cytochrome P450 reductase